jgi:chromatin segregation and condensation protein Rec8/ScpA/Scc1 (kleisin family)
LLLFRVVEFISSFELVIKMGFEDFLPSELAESSNEDSESSLPASDLLDEPEEDSEKIGPSQFYGIITSNKPDWQVIIYDLIHSEQLDPWDIDIVILTRKYFERIYEIEESEDGGMDFYASSKVLLAASLLLRIKSEFLLNRSIKDIDEALFGKKVENRPVMERIIVNEDELPMLIPKTPLPRARRVTLPELMSALNKAINTESRRIKREVSVKRAKRISEINLPEFRRIDLKDRIKQFYARVLTSIKGKAIKPDRDFNKIGYGDLIGKEREEKIACFLPLLHLSNNKKLWLEQENHLEEIWVYLHKYYENNQKVFFNDVEDELEDFNEEDFVEEEMLSGLDKARVKREEKKRLAEEIAKELEGEFGIVEEVVGSGGEVGVGLGGGGGIGSGVEEVERLEKEEKIDKISGFDDNQ